MSNELDLKNWLDLRPRNRVRNEDKSPQVALVSLDRWAPTSLDCARSTEARNHNIDYDFDNEKGTITCSPANRLGWLLVERRAVSQRMWYVEECSGFSRRLLCGSEGLVGLDV